MREDIEKEHWKSVIILSKKCHCPSNCQCFRVSKSTVHKDVTERLPAIDHTLADEVRTVLNVNKAERHIRGGLATKEKYLHAHEDCTD